MSDDYELIRLLTAEDGWDCAIAILEDCYPLIPLTKRGYAVRDLIRIEQRRRDAYKRHVAEHKVAPT